MYQGFTIAQYNAQFVKQDGCCAICRTSTPAHPNKHFHVDHDHATGAVRGLLCVLCNTAIGKLNDDPELVARALDYLQHPPAIAT